MRKPIVMLAAILVASLAQPVLAIEAPILMRESARPAGSNLTQGCPLEANLTGDCANLRYYNLCSGYIWVHSLPDLCGETVGVLFNDDCVRPGNIVTRGVTYWRNVTPGYGEVNVSLDVDSTADNCPDYPLAQDLAYDPGLRWNCHAFDSACIPPDTDALILRAGKCSGASPTFATDGPFTEDCDPVGTPRSYYYGVDGSACQIWVGPTGRFDNFLYWLIVNNDCAVTTTTVESWGSIKALYR